MALSLENQALFADYDQLRKRVAMAFYRVAREVIEEDITIAGHPLRVRFAQVVYNNNYTEFFKYGSVIASDPLLIDSDPQQSSDISDEFMVDIVRGNWNAIAGYFPEPEPEVPNQNGI